MAEPSTNSEMEVQALLNESSEQGSTTDNMMTARGTDMNRFKQVTCIGQEMKQYPGLLGLTKRLEPRTTTDFDVWFDELESKMRTLQGSLHPHLMGDETLDNIRPPANASRERRDVFEHDKLATRSVVISCLNPEIGINRFRNIRRYPDAAAILKSLRSRHSGFTSREKLDNMYMKIRTVIPITSHIVEDFLHWDATIDKYNYERARAVSPSSHPRADGWERFDSFDRVFQREIFQTWIKDIKRNVKTNLTGNDAIQFWDDEWEERSVELKELLEQVKTYALIQARESDPLPKGTEKVLAVQTHAPAPQSKDNNSKNKSKGKNKNKGKGQNGCSKCKTEAGQSCTHCHKCNIPIPDGWAAHAYAGECKVLREETKAKTTRKQEPNSVMFISSSIDTLEDVPSNINAVQPHTIDTGDIYYDPGAAGHLTGLEARLTDVHDIEPMLRKSANSTFVTTRAGTLTIPFLLPDNTVEVCKIENVGVLPELGPRLTLFSPAVYARQRLGNDYNSIDSQLHYGTIAHTVHHEPDDPRKLWYLTDFVGPSQYVRTTTSMNPVFAITSKHTWLQVHEALGHPSYKVMQYMYKQSTDNSQWPSTPLTPEEIQSCSACIAGRSHQLPYVRSTHQRIVGKTLVTDLAGPLPPTYGGGCYICILVDQASGYIWGTVQATKDAALPSLKKWLNAIKTWAEKNNTNQIPTVLRSDNGGEFKSMAISNLLNEMGIEQQFTTPYTPQQNGTAERYVGIIFDKVRTLLNGSSLELKAWGEAFNYAIYIINREPRVRHKGKSAFEIWFKEKPESISTTPWGSPCYFLAPAHEIHNKLQSRSLLGYFVGVGETHQASFRILLPGDPPTIQYARSITPLSKEAAENAKWPRDIIMSKEPPKVMQKELKEKKSSKRNQSSVGEDNNSVGDQNNTPMFSIWNQAEDAELCLAVQFESDTPNINKALNGPNADQWRKAILEEETAHVHNKTFEIIENPGRTKVLGYILLCRAKRGLDGKIARYKVRCVARGDQATQGVHFHETFAPTQTYWGFRMILSIAAANPNWVIHNIDVKTAYVLAPLDPNDYILMEIPREFKLYKTDGFKNPVFRVRRSLYGLPPSGRNWNKLIDDKLRTVLGLIPSVTEPAIYVHSSGTLVGVYVDDITIAGPEKVVLELKSTLASLFPLTDNDLLKWTLGMRVTQDPKSIILDQCQYARDLLKTYHLEQTPKFKTPLAVNPVLHPAEADEVLPIKDIRRYQAILGSIMYMMVATRPDLAYAIGTVSQFSAAPSSAHMAALIRIVGYIRQTVDYKLVYSRVESEHLAPLNATSDASFGTEWERHGHSLEGYIIKLGDHTVHWRARRQKVVARSTLEAEYIALADCTREVIIFRNLLAELQRPIHGASTIYTDSRGAHDVANTDRINPSQRHHAMRIWFVRDYIRLDEIKTTWIPSETNIADGLTKPLRGAQHQAYCEALRLKAN